jgi:hypothetical protein
MTEGPLRRSFFLLVVLVVPLLVIGSGIWIWWKQEISGS